MLQIDATTLCVIGAGPRGLSVVERACANASATGQPVVVHIVEPYLRLGCRVWRTSQPSVLLMNTVASQVTMFTDESVNCEGPLSEGPSLYEWAKLLERLEPFVPYPPHVYEEARHLGPDSYPTRSFYGRYLGWVFDRLIRTVPEHIAVETHGCRALAVRDEADGSQTVTLENGVELTGCDAIVLALGHVDMPLSDEERRLGAFATEHGLAYVPRGNPADADLGDIAPGETVALRGMGLNFFDHLALLTTGRGGSFVREAGRLRYRPSGNEPQLIAGSRRGAPYHSRGENQKGATGRHHPLFLTEEVIARFRRRKEAGRPAGFTAEVWPLVDLEVRAVYYHALIAGERGRYDADVFLAEFCKGAGAPGDGPGSAASDGPGSAASEEALLERFGVGEEKRWSWDRIARPYGDREFTDAASYRAWLLDHLRQDIAEARRGNVRGPLKAALDVMRDLRNEVRLVVDHAGITGGSYRDELQSWYTPLNAFVSIGPPLSRIEEMAALMEAGVLDVVGPGMRVDASPGRTAFVVRSDRVPGPDVEATALIEARLPEFDLRTTTDPLVRDLVAQGACRRYALDEPGREPWLSGGLAVTPKPYHVVGGDGVPHPRRFAFGIPTESVHWATAAGIRPGSDSVILGDADAIARTALAGRRRAPAGAGADSAAEPKAGQPVTTLEGD
ncbi:FAD/NAD(P)-binding protein [Streptomyces sp. NPDC047108]|uniref:FAD/NAD(P)-binding protein n=1 Tax=Streptomyces sp. NPDC047108 TaxID=3155025 RepID=UPI0033E702FF